MGVQGVTNERTQFRQTEIPEPPKRPVQPVGSRTSDDSGTTGTPSIKRTVDERKNTQKVFDVWSGGSDLANKTQAKIPQRKPDDPPDPPGDGGGVPGDGNGLPGEPKPPLGPGLPHDPNDGMVHLPPPGLPSDTSENDDNSVAGTTETDYPAPDQTP